MDCPRLEISFPKTQAGRYYPLLWYVNDLGDVVDVVRLLGPATDYATKAGAKRSAIRYLKRIRSLPIVEWKTHAKIL